jgi:hypothetical protein
VQSASGVLYDASTCVASCHRDRLRAAHVGFEDRKILLGHKSDHVTTHYCAPEVGAMIEASERVCEPKSRKSPTLAIVRAQRDEAQVADSIGGKGGTCFPCFPLFKPMIRLRPQRTLDSKIAAFVDQLCTYAQSRAWFRCECDRRFKSGAGFDTYLMRIPRKKRPEDAQVAQRLSGLDASPPSGLNGAQEPSLNSLLPDIH